MDKYLVATILPNSVFVHIPKTGGTWVTAVLKKMGIVQRVIHPHERPKNYRHIVGDRLYFTFVRNPLTWYQSRWSGEYARHVHPRKLKNQAGLHFENERELNDFRYWLDNAIQRGSATSFFNEYINECDVIGKTESLSTDLVNVLTQAGERFNPKHVNTGVKNKGAELDRKYTKNLIKKIIHHDGDFMKKFNYPIEWQAYTHLLS